MKNQEHPVVDATTLKSFTWEGVAFEVCEAGSDNSKEHEIIESLPTFSVDTFTGEVNIFIDSFDLMDNMEWSYITVSANLEDFIEHSIEMSVIDNPDHPKNIEGSIDELRIMAELFARQKEKIDSRIVELESLLPK